MPLLNGIGREQTHDNGNNVWVTTSNTITYTNSTSPDVGIRYDSSPTVREISFNEEVQKMRENIKYYESRILACKEQIFNLQKEFEESDDR